MPESLEGWGLNVGKKPEKKAPKKVEEAEEAGPGKAVGLELAKKGERIKPAALERERTRQEAAKEATKATESEEERKKEISERMKSQPKVKKTGFFEKQG